MYWWYVQWNSNILNDLRLATDQTSNLELISQLMHRKKKLDAINHHGWQIELQQFVIKRGPRMEEPSCLERQLDLKIRLDLKWNSYIINIEKHTGKMFYSLKLSKKTLTSQDILCFYKRHIWHGVIFPIRVRNVQTQIACLDRV